MGITFRGGPGERRQGMLLSRAPIFLRVVVDEAGRVDALDRLDDTPGPGETVHVYRRVGGVGVMCARGRGCFPLAEYEFLPDADGELVRGTLAWQEWCEAQDLEEVAV